MNTKEKAVMPVRVDKNLKDAFIKSAKAKDRNGSQLIRDFMRDYVKKNGQGELL